MCLCGYVYRVPLLFLHVYRLRLFSIFSLRLCNLPFIEVEVNLYHTFQSTLPAKASLFSHSDTVMPLKSSRLFKLCHEHSVACVCSCMKVDDIYFKMPH